MGLLVAGTKYRGEFEERLKKLMEEIKQNKDIILVCHWSVCVCCRVQHAGHAGPHAVHSTRWLDHCSSGLHCRAGVRICVLP